MVDHALTDNARFGKRVLDEKLVKETWKRCSKDEDELPDDWQSAKGVLVGISTPHPQGSDR